MGKNHKLAEQQSHRKAMAQKRTSKQKHHTEFLSDVAQKHTGLESEFQTLEVKGVTEFSHEVPESEWLTEEAVAYQVQMLAKKTGQTTAQVLEQVAKVLEKENATGNHWNSAASLFDYGVWWQQWSKYWLNVTNSFFQPSQR